jgi:23S rRNA pseudouridine1911/1915/1917 synthase
VPDTPDDLDDDLDGDLVESDHEGGRARVVIPAAQHGTRLDQALAVALPHCSRSQLQRLVKDGRVTRPDGTPATRPSVTVADGEEFFVEVPPPAPTSVEPQALPLDVVFEDSDIIVVNKSAGMVVHPAAGHADGTLVNALLHHVDDLSGVGGEMRPGIVHRLDRGTSGLMVVAKSDRAHTELARQFHDREVTKEYVALVWGVVVAGRRIEEPIGRDPANRQKMSTRARRSRAAVTRVLRVHPLPGLTLAQLGIATGRTHQIRVHLASIGHPVVGDALYGGVHRRVPPHLKAVSRLDRPFLHAARLAFTHPVDGQPLEFTAALPQDLQSVLDDIEAARERFGV